MSTNDVPGAKQVNNDTLAMGSWAEHDDGSLIYVESTENGVIYLMFDMSKDPIVEYRDKMAQTLFEKHFSWDGKNEKWTWHDKTLFPWDKVIKHGASDGIRHVSAHDQLTAAAKVANSLRTKGKTIDADDYKNYAEMHTVKGKTIINRIQSAINELRK